MNILCPTCHGKGTIPDPKYNGEIMCIAVWPQVTCQTCGGSGWVLAPYPIYPSPYSPYPSPYPPYPYPYPYPYYPVYPIYWTASGSNTDDTK